MYFKLFEEFNNLNGKSFAEKLILYVKASDITTHISPIRESEHKELVFDFTTNMRADNGPGFKKFIVTIPTDFANKARVETVESDKIVLTVSLEPNKENDINLILLNFFEATGLYDDSSTENIIDAYDSIKSVDDIKRIIAKMG